jgi:hypothetical protein
MAELFRLTAARVTCYVIRCGQQAAHSTLIRNASCNIRLENNKFDGTKLPMVVSTSLNRDMWYEFRTSPDSTLQLGIVSDPLDPVIPYSLDTNPVIVVMARRQVDEVLADRKRTC